MTGFYSFSCFRASSRSILFCTFCKPHAFSKNKAGNKIFTSGFFYTASPSLSAMTCLNSSAGGFSFLHFPARQIPLRKFRGENPFIRLSSNISFPPLRRCAGIHLKAFGVWGLFSLHTFLVHFPKQNFVNIRSMISSPSVSPVISPSVSQQAFRSMEAQSKSMPASRARIASPRAPNAAASAA